MTAIDYSLMQFCDMQGWVAKQTMQPFDFVEVYFNPLCIAVLPMRDHLSVNDLKYIAIKNLYHKMLAVLELESYQLLIATMPYNNHSQKSQNLLTKKLLFFNPKSILIFGEPDFLDMNLLSLENIVVFSTFSPEYLLENLAAKRQAHQDLLSCKQQLAQMS